MAPAFFQDPEEVVCFFVVIFAPIIVAGLTALRFVATRRAHRSPGLEDYMALLGLVTFVLFCLLSLVSTTYGDGRAYDVVAAEDPERYARFQKLVFGALIAFLFNSLFTKLSILALLHRIFGIKQEYAVAIYIVAASQIVWLVAMVILQAVQCRPTAKFWNVTLEGHCIRESVVILISEIPNSASDLVVVFLALCMLRPIQVSSAAKCRLNILFSLGSISILPERFFSRKSPWSFSSLPDWRRGLSVQSSQTPRNMDYNGGGSATDLDLLEALHEPSNGQFQGEASYKGDHSTKVKTSPRPDV
ncbi:hypothetical protein PFICI_14320 [Pestalotiopsis fici W106-1]|uniref:Rhodopsin domain-containing protein n=1 Tax=Pestalotiopsis fici (strain W106-1 / CGMCC3.15140) TaxID=1229662 RepID=W3WL30_PESFW|nr:uncharacterized protein PFICI_14320 [Pestalotiopsis fici W106-1]ETS74454.1 hypothetical protein PFICI_14320 [Pestalotiopsis fici W106-1]